jgi:hypothetical protein
MKWIKLFEDFKQNNEIGDLISIDDIIKANDNGEKIYATIIEEIPGNDPKEPLDIKDIDEDGLITVDYKGKIGYVKLSDVKQIGEKQNESIDSDIDLQSIIDSIPDSDIPRETNIIKQIGDKIVYVEGWCDRCFSNYDVHDRDEMVQMAREIGERRLKQIPRLPQYKRFSGKEMIDYKFIELPNNEINYCLSIGIYQ